MNSSRKYRRAGAASKAVPVFVWLCCFLSGFVSPALSALHYSYDVSGNVKTLVHDLRTIVRAELRMKRVDYEYDLYSGKVLLAAYNRGMADQLFQSYTYDADNRIVSASTSPDGLAYFYDAGKNRLRNVQDYSSTTAYQTDIPYNVGDTNLALYTYDLNGQLTKDVLGGVSSVSWNRFGKVEGMSKADGSSLSFDYDGLGNRVSKTYERRPSPDSLVISKTVYVRDAAGNPLAVYEDRKEYDVSRLTIEDMMATPVRTVMGGDIAPPLDWVKGVSRRLVKAYHSDTTANLAVLLVGLPQLADYVRDREAVGSLVSKLDQGQLRTFVQTMPDVVGYALGGKTIAGEGEAVVGKEVYGASLSTYLEPVFLSVGMRPWQQAVLLAVREADGSEGDVFRWFCSQLGVSDSAVAGFPGDTAVLSAFNNLGWEERYGITKGLSELLVQQRGVLPDTVRSALVSAYGRGNSHVDFIKDLPWSGRVYEQLGKDADIYIAHRYDLRDGGLLDAATVTGPFENNGVLLSALSRQGTFPLEVEDEALVETVLGADVDKVISLAKGAGQGEVLRDAFAKEFGRSGWLDAWYAEQQVLFRDRVFLSEHHLYGSSRLGMQKYLPTAVGYEPRPVSGAYAPNRLVQPRGWYSRVGEDVFVGNNYNGTLGQSKVWQSGDTFTRRHLLGHRHYELSDHLGNVRATVLDQIGFWGRKTVIGNGGLPVSSYMPALLAQVSSATDYHPFGMPMVGRSYGDSVKRCVPVSWQVWLERGWWEYLADTKDASGNSGKKVRALARRYGTEGGSEDSLGLMAGASSFSKEALQVYHSRERGSSDPVVEAYDVEVDLDSGGVGSTVGYKLDLGGEPVDGYRVFLGVPLDSVGDGEVLGLKYRMSGLGSQQEEDVVAQVRVRQYYEGGGASYYALLDWQNVEGEEQQLNIPIDRERVGQGGRTYVEWRFAKRGGGSGTFGDKKIDLRNIKAEEKKWGWYTKTVYSCEEEDNYRYGFNGKEKDNEVKGKGNSLDFGARMYDSRLGRWMSLDPLAAKYPMLSPYNFAGNNPIRYIDPDGKRITDPQGHLAAYVKNGEIVLTKYADKDTRTGIQLMSKTEIGSSVLRDMIKVKHNVDLHIDHDKIQYYDPKTGKREDNPTPTNKLMLGAAERYLTKDKELTRYKVTVYEKSIEHVREQKGSFDRDGYKVNAAEKSTDDMVGAQFTHEGTHTTDEKSQGFRDSIDKSKIEDLPNKNERQHYEQLEKK